MARVLLLCVFLSLEILQCYTSPRGSLEDFRPEEVAPHVTEHFLKIDPSFVRNQQYPRLARQTSADSYQQIALLQEIASFDCTVVSADVTEVSIWWEKDNINITVDPGDSKYILTRSAIQKATEGQVSSKLTVKNITWDDDGNYSCRARDGGTGQVEGEMTTLVVQAQERDPSVGEYFQEAVDLANRTRWRYFLPEETDIDQDGNLSDLEVQHKFNTYMGEVFKLMDQDKNNSITEEELRSLKLDIPHLTKVVDIALENFPLKPFLLAADGTGNGDGVFDENDFYIPEKQLKLEFPEPNTTVWLDDYDHRVSHYNHRVALNILGVAKIGQNEGTVICKSLGYDGLERVLEADQIKNAYFYKVLDYTCDGTEARLEDCQENDGSHTKYTMGDGMGVVCQGEEKSNALRLVGGKDSSSGDIFLGRKGLTWIPWEYRQSTFQVICRELGFSNVVKTTQGSEFTGAWPVRDHLWTNQQLECTGKEQRLADCPKSHIERNLETSLVGVVCSNDKEAGIDQGLSELVRWRRSSSTWENNGRFLFIADANDDGKLTLEELAKKGKELITKILEFLDENQDGKISLEDINLHLSLGPIQNLVLELFNDFTADDEEFDLYNIKLFGVDLADRFEFSYEVRGLHEMDRNGDEKLNLADFFMNLDGNPEKAMFLIPMLSLKLDKNQDGKIHRDELRQFINEMFNQLDLDNDDTITLEDVYSLLRENGLDCLQVGALRSFIKVFLQTIDTETRNMFGYIFHQFDLDGNGQISQTELEQMHIPCTFDFDRSRVIDFDSNAKRPCEMMIDGFKIGELIRSFPDSIFSERRGRGGRDEARKETLVDKLTNRACEMLT